MATELAAGYVSLTVKLAKGGMADVTKEVTKAGKAGGTGYGDEFSKEAAEQVGRKLPDAVDKTVKRSRSRIDKTGKDVGGGFGDGLREGIEDAMSKTDLGRAIESAGIDISDALKSPLEEARGAFRGWAGGVADEIKAGNIEGAVGQVTDAVRGATGIIDGLGDHLGFDTSGLDRSVAHVTGKMDEVARSIQSVPILPDLIGAGAGVAFEKAVEKGMASGLTAAGAARVGATWTIPITVAAYLTWFEIEHPFVNEESRRNVALGRYPERRSDEQIRREGIGAPPPLELGGGPGAQAARHGNPNPVIDEILRGVTGRAAGGVVAGPGGTDNVLSWLTAGEGVVKASAMANGGAAIVAALNAQGYVPGFAEGLNPGADYLRSLIMQMWPQIGSVGGRRADKLPEHPSGNAIDIMIPGWNTPAGKALGDAVAGFVATNAQSLGLTHFIWQQRIFKPGDMAGKLMGDRGSPTQNHMDHVHVWLQAGGGKLPSGPLIGAGAVGGGAIPGSSSSGGGGGGGGGGAGGAGGAGGLSENPMRALQQIGEQQKQLDTAKGAAIRKLLPDFGELADIGVAGLKETLLPPGFSDPTQWKSVASVGNLLGWIGGISGDPATASILGGIGSAITGSGSGLYQGILGAIPQPFGTLPAPAPQPGAPAAPGQPGGGGIIINGDIIDKSGHAMNDLKKTEKFNTMAPTTTVRNMVRG